MVCYSRAPCRAEAGEARRSGAVLIASADLATQDQYVSWLRDCRIRVFGVDGWQDVLAIVRATPVDVIVQDILAAPDWSGCDVLRHSEGTGQIPLIALTGWLTHRERRIARDLRCAAYAAKPCAPEVLEGLVDRVREQCSGREQRPWA